jgi:transcriptional regulator NrdR family protein
MKSGTVEVIKSSGKRVKFSLSKLRSSLKRSGASKETIDAIIDTVRDELYQGISTNEIYNRAYALLKKQKSYLASRYKLKKAIYELGAHWFSV